jgi:hypothetical protein
VSRSSIAVSLVIAGAVVSTIRVSRRARRGAGRQQAAASRALAGDAPQQTGQQAHVRGSLRWTWRHPGLWAAFLAAAIYVNQLLVSVYIWRMHGGDPHFISRYLPEGWFALPRNTGALGWLIAHWPAPALLAPSVLRVQAVCELPLVVCTYLTVCWWLGADAYRRALLRVPRVCLWWTAALGLAEGVLRTPYTFQDLVLRAVAALATPIAVRRLGMPAGPDDRGPRSAAGLVGFAVSLAALGGLLLIVYDTALLYNAARLPAELAAAALCGGVLAAARTAARLLARPVAGPRVSALISITSQVVVVFFIPVLPIRYGLVFGARPAAALGAVVVAAVALRAADAELGDSEGARAGRLAPAAGIGVAGAAVAYACSGGYPETRLLAALASMLILTTASAALLDRRGDTMAAAPQRDVPGGHRSLVRFRLGRGITLDEDAAVALTTFAREAISSERGDVETCLRASPSAPWPVNHNAVSGSASLRSCTSPSSKEGE